MFEEKYKKGSLQYPTEVINYVVYKRRGEVGIDEVLQHKWIFLQWD